MKGILTFFFLFVSLLSQPSLAYGHFLESDHKIGAVIHVTPNDEPIAGIQSTFSFEFKDEENKFRSVDCECKFIVKEAGKTIYSQDLAQNKDEKNINKVSINYTFPQKGAYVVQIVGKSQVFDEFEPFTLSWDFNVDQQANSQAIAAQGDTSNRYVHFALIFGFSILLVAVIVWRSVIRKRHGLKENADD